MHLRLIRETGTKSALLWAALLVAACSHTHDNVRDAGNGLHSVTASANWGGYTGSREETIAFAADFCAGSRQAPVIDSFVDQPGVGPKGEQTSTLTFACATRPVLQYR